MCVVLVFIYCTIGLRAMKLKKKLLRRYNIFVFHSVFSLLRIHCVLLLAAIEWVMMSSAELFIAQLFFLAGFFISKRLDGISTIHSVRRSQKRKLWSVVIVFEVRMVWEGKIRYSGKHSLTLTIEKFYGKISFANIVWVLSCSFYSRNSTMWWRMILTMSVVWE